MHQDAIDDCSRALVPNSSVGFQPFGSISSQLQAPAGFQFPNTAPGITQNFVLGSTPSLFADVAPSTRPGTTPDTTPTIAPSIPIGSLASTASDINPGCTPITALGTAPSSASDTTPGSHSTAKMEMVAATPTSNNAPSTAQMPGQVATPRRQPMLQSQKRKALVKPISLSTQHGTAPLKSSIGSEPLHEHSLHLGNIGEPQQQQQQQQQALPPRGMADTAVHQQAPDSTAAHFSSAKKRKKLLQQRILPFQAASGEAVTTPDKPPVSAKPRTKKPNTQPVSPGRCVSQLLHHALPCHIASTWQALHCM